MFVVVLFCFVLLQEIEASFSTQKFLSVMGIWAAKLESSSPRCLLGYDALSSSPDRKLSLLAAYGLTS